MRKVGDPTRNNPEDGPYDYVYISGYLEFDLNPIDTIVRWWKSVEVGGRMVVKVPLFTQPLKDGQVTWWSFEATGIENVFALSCIQRTILNSSSVELARDDGVTLTVLLVKC